MSTTPPSTTQQLAEFVVGARYENIPPHIIGLARNAIFDCIGTTLAGSREECGQIAAATTQAFASGAQATVIGAGFKASAPFAAMVNGTAGHALDYDDASVNIHGHASVAIVPALLALAEIHGSSGRDILAAYVMAFEVGQRISNGINPQHYELGWHTTSTIGSLRAVAGAARILGLDVEATRRAWGIAASMACGLIQNFGTMSKPLHAGLAAQNGVLAAMLAARRYTADLNILESPQGFCNTLCAGKPYDLARMVAGIGSAPYCLEEPGIVFKPYPCCRASHVVIDGVLDLRNEYKLRPEDIEKVRCGVSYLRVRLMRYSDPQTVDQSRFSMEHNVAVALVDGRAGLAQFTLEKLRDPTVQAMMKRVDMYVHPTMETRLSQSAEVEITLRDGRVLQRWIETPLGSPGNLMPHAMMVEKFVGCADGTLDDATCRQAVSMIENFDDQPNVHALMKTLQGKARS